MELSKVVPIYCDTRLEAEEEFSRLHTDISGGRRQMLAADIDGDPEDSERPILAVLGVLDAKSEVPGSRGYIGYPTRWAVLVTVGDPEMPVWKRDDPDKVSPVNFPQGGLGEINRG